MPPATPAIQVEYLYHDPAKNNDPTDQPVGPIAYVSYSVGTDDTRAEVSFKADGSHPPQGELCGFDDIDLNDAEQAARNLLALLNDPRVQAARVRFEAGRTAEAGGLRCASSNGCSAANVTNYALNVTSLIA